MEELKKRYMRIFLVFAVLMGSAVAFLRGQLNSMTEAQKVQEVQAEKQQVVEELKIEEQQDGEKTETVEYTLEAQQVIEEMGSNIDSAIQKLIVAQNLGEPLQKAKASLMLASAYEQKNEINMAIDTYKIALENLQNIQEKKEIHKKIAELHLYQDEQSAALAHYELVYNMTKETDDFQNMAELLAKQNEINKLKVYYDKHIAWFPESTEQLSKYGSWLKMKSEL